MRGLFLLLLSFAAGMVAADSTLALAALHYRYTDCSTWPALEQKIPDLCKRIEKMDNDLLNAEELHETAVAAFHLIWNMQDYASGRTVLAFLEQSAYACPELLCYFKGKLLFFQTEYAQALQAFARAGEITESDAERVELRSMLKAIGSYNDTDPDGIEAALFEAIVTNDTANTLLNIDRGQEAIALFEHALRIQKRAYGTTQHANVAYTLRCLANAYAVQGDLTSARTAYEQALAICDAVYTDKSHPEIIALREALQAFAAATMRV